MQEHDLHLSIVIAAKRLYQRNLLAAADGNISIRITDQRILITPAGKSKALLTPEEMAEISLDNTTLRGNPSSERLMHLAIYKKCPKARAVVHAHPPTAIAWSIARPHLTELPHRSLSELILAVGRLPIVPYARSGTQAMGDVLGPFLPDHRVMILSRHGALAWGETLEEAVNGIERLEHVADILLRAEQLGRITDLPDEEIEALKKMREMHGNRTI